MKKHLFKDIFPTLHKCDFLLQVWLSGEKSDVVSHTTATTLYSLAEGEGSR